MKIDCNELFPKNLSDECAYHLMHFFHDLAFVFQKMHVLQIIRHENNVIFPDDCNYDVKPLNDSEEDNYNAFPF